jgi:REP element-mobilizing transposase RayT
MLGLCSKTNTGRPQGGLMTNASRRVQLAMPRCSQRIASNLAPFSDLFGFWLIERAWLGDGEFIAIQICSIKLDGVPKNGYQRDMTAARSRKRHVQQELFRRGGKRRGAGRKPKGVRAGSSHRKRPAVKPYHALHVILRVVPQVGSLRRRLMYRAMREATVVAAVRERIRIVHISVQRTHVHLLVEAEDTQHLARGMQGFQVSAARNINTILGDGKYRRRRGQVFVGRYHLVVIKSPTQARHAISYVLSNFRKHGEDKEGLASTWLVDPFSSGISFPDWQEMERRDLMWPIRETYDPLTVRRPEGWLLREGWKRAGAISARDVPGGGPG